MSYTESPAPASPQRSRRWYWIQVALAIGILVPAGLGFGNKLREFILLYTSHERQRAQRQVAREDSVPPAADTPARHFTSQEIEDGGFALVPILNYLLVSAGFLLLFFAALLHGMFRDIEKPKHQMLENEALLDSFEDARARQAAESVSVGD
jgi:hypothetical protein